LKKNERSYLLCFADLALKKQSFIDILLLLDRIAKSVLQKRINNEGKSPHY
jgi:hypothetical protein